MMMEAVIYGPTPSIMIEREEIPPPEKMSRRPRNWLPASSLSRLAISTPGIGIFESKRKTTKAPRAKTIRLRMIGSLRTIPTF